MIYKFLLNLYEDADVYYNRTEIVNDVSNVSYSYIELESDGDEYFYDCEVEETFFDCQKDVRVEVDGIERANDFQKLLAAWAVDCQVKQVHVNKLLSVFKLFRTSKSLLVYLALAAPFLVQLEKLV